LDDSSQIVWLGSLQHLLPEIAAGGSCRVVVPLMVLNSGQWKILYSAEGVGNSDKEESLGGYDVFWNSEPIFLKCL
jgi:hypothetical protein